MLEHLFSSGNVHLQTMQPVYEPTESKCLIPRHNHQ